jgi:hypothetical protein
MNFGMAPGTGTTEKRPNSLVVEERGVAMAFQTEHSLFLPLQKKLVG